MYDDRDNEFLTDVASLASAGIEPPAAWAELRQRLDDFTAMTTPVRDRLANALINPAQGDDVEALRALAYAEAGNTSAVNNTIRARVIAQMRQVYAEVAADNYGVVAQRFDSAAAAFIAAADAVDPESTAVAMVEAADKPRKAWLAAESFANELTRLTTTLAVAARLAGVPGTDTLPVQLALCCDPGSAHRRRTWMAWVQQDGRCGRWSALATLGVVVRAWPSDRIGAVEGYRMAKPLEQRVEQRDGRTFHVQVDPEDPVTLSAIDPVKRNAGRMQAV